VLPFFKVIEESGILPHYTLSYEPAVGFAADAAARTPVSASPSSPLGLAHLIQSMQLRLTVRSPAGAPQILNNS
jgi:indolepyruvate decarboxylase